MATIKDIANYTGVSPTTVSNVIHGRVEKVSPETRKKVEQALKELNYHSFMGGRLLAKKGSRIIGVIIQDSEAIMSHKYDNPYLGELLQALETAIREAGFFMMVQRVTSIEDGLRLAEMWHLEGLILSGANPDNLSAWQENIATPIVFLDSYPENEEKILNVGIDDFDASKKMTHYLMQNGHKKIAFAAYGQDPKDWRGVDAVRAAGVKEAMEEEHLIPNFLALPVRKAEFEETLLSYVRDDHNQITALFFASDLAATMAMTCLVKHGLQIPEDISIVSFDGTLLTALAIPQITAIKQDVLAKAQAAVVMLIEASKVKILNRNIQLKTAQVLGQSVSNLVN